MAAERYVGIFSEVIFALSRAFMTVSDRAKTFVQNLNSHQLVPSVRNLFPKNRESERVFELPAAAVYRRRARSCWFHNNFRRAFDSLSFPSWSRRNGENSVGSEINFQPVSKMAFVLPGCVSKDFKAATCAMGRPLSNLSLTGML